jgi:chromosome segregation ATPase
MEENQAVLNEYINELKKIISEMSAESALAKAKNSVQSKISSEALSKQKEMITGLAAKVSSLEKEQPVDDFTYGDEQPVDDFTYGDEQSVEQVTEEKSEKTKSSVEVDLLRQVQQLQASSVEQEDYISRLEAGIEEGNKVIADAEGSRDKALERLRELEESQQEALKKANTLEASQQAALKKAKELEEKLKQRPATAPASNVVSMKSKKLEEDISKMEKTNLKLLKDLTAAENKIKELKDKAAKGKI